VAKLWAIMPAAGVGSRMGLEFPKQYLTVAGKPIIQHSMELLLGIRDLTKLVVCLSPHDVHFSHLDVTHPALHTTLGGASRAQSVLNGLLAIQDEVNADDWVLVHDAARPCLEPRVLSHFINVVQSDDVGGILALKAKDTLKRAGQGEHRGRILETLDRSDVWQAQTPQMFRYALLFNALNHALTNQLDVTDEASALEYQGHAVKLVDGSAANIKVTNPEDQALAEFLLSERHTR